MKNYVVENSNELSSETKYYYPKETESNSFQKALKIGMHSKEIKVIKKFQCDCLKHHNITLVALVPQYKKDLIIRRCEFIGQSDMEIVITNEGQILFKGYQFYSTHPNWKVRRAVAVGLGKLRTEKAFNLLFSLLTDLHFDVVLATLQSLEKFGPPILTELTRLVDNIDQKHVQHLVHRLIKKIKFGMCFDGSLEQSLGKLSKSQLVMKIPKKSQKTKLLVPRKILYSLFSIDYKRKHFNHWDRLNIGINKIKHSIQLNGKKVLIKRNRFTAKNVKKNKLNHTKSLFFRDAVPIESIKDIVNPQKGEIYWAITDARDPKMTRPVLIIAAVDQKSGDVRVAPLTTDTLWSSDKNLIVEFANTKNTVQLWRQKTIHRSSLLNKYGEISRDDFEKVTQKMKEFKQDYAPPQKVKTKLSTRTPHKSSSLEYYIEDIPQSFLPEPKIAVIPHPTSLTTNENALIVKKRKKDNLTLLDFLPSSLLITTKGECSTAIQPNNCKGKEAQDISGKNLHNKPFISRSSNQKNKDRNASIKESLPALTLSTQKKTFSTLTNCSLNTFKKIVPQISDLNQRCSDKKGDTPLMVLLRRKELRTNNEIPKIKILLRYGALWTKQNNYGESAENLAENHNPTLIASLRNLK